MTWEERRKTQNYYYLFCVNKTYFIEKNVATLIIEFKPFMWKEFTVYGIYDRKT